MKRRMRRSENYDETLIPGHCVGKELQLAEQRFPQSTPVGTVLYNVFWSLFIWLIVCAQQTEEVLRRCAYQLDA